MERLFSIIQCFVKTFRKEIVTFCFFIFFSSGIVVNSQNVINSSLLRFPVWYVIEEAPVVPTRIEQGDTGFEEGLDGIRRLAPFFIEALIYGWEFTYTPSDEIRGVKEYFRVEPIVSMQGQDIDVRIKQVVVGGQESRLEAWVEFDLDARMIHERQRWVDANPVSVTGRGSASVYDGIENVEIACELAARNAIRAYAQSIIKNKPKEITGKVQLTDLPRYYIDAGKYVADLDFFLIVSTIEEYTYF